MTNVYSTPEKVSLKRRLFSIGVEVLEREGYKVEREYGSGKASVRRVTKNGKEMLVSIRTTQDRHIAYPRKRDNSGWLTLDDIDMVVAVSVDKGESPKNAWVHFLPADEMRDRFNRAYKARVAAGRKIPLGRGVWLSLYKPEANDPPDLVGAGAGLKHPKIAVIPLAASSVPSAAASTSVEPPLPNLTIPEAKRLLARSLGVSESSIKITVEA
jgi:hypothetical protein